MADAISVEEVTGGKALARFTELPRALHGHDARWAPPVMAWERFRLDPRRNPYFERGDGVYLLARHLGRPAGRLAVHVAEPGGEGRFGFWTSVDSPAVAAALVAAGRAWLADQGCGSMTGPCSFERDDEPGVLVAGGDEPGLTGRPWHPPWESRLLVDLDFEPVADQPTWRLPVLTEDSDRPLVDDAPGHAGPHADPRLVLVGVAAVPDVADALRATGVRAAVSLARRARARDWRTCTIVRCEEAPDVAVPALQAAAGRAGYQDVIAPWSPDPGARPETVHRTYRLTW